MEVVLLANALARPRSTTLAILVLVIAVPSVAHAGAASGWSRVRTPRFTVVSPGPAGDAQRVAGAVDAFWSAFRRLVPGAKTDPLAPTIVLAFDWARYEPYAPRYDGRPLRVAGSFVGTAQANYLALTLDQGAGAWSVAYHELTHLIVTQTLPRPPAWFNEGIAEFYSTFTMTPEGDAQLGDLIPEHIVLLRRERWLSLDELFEVTTASPLYNEGDKRSMFYAEAWALVHYLLSSGPERAQQLFDFLARLAEGQGTPSAFRSAFRMAPATLQEEVQRYVLQAEWPVQRYAIGDRGSGSATSLTPEPIGEADALAILAGLQLRFDRQDEAMGLAQMAVGLDDRCAAAWTTLTATHIERQLHVEAVPFLLKAASHRLHDPYTGYLLGTSAIRVLESTSESVLRRHDALAIALRSLQGAVAQVPTYAEAWAALAHAWLLDGTQADRALSASRRALALAPARRHYVLLEAQALIQRDDFAGARRLMEHALERDAGTIVADKAAEVLTRLTALEQIRMRRPASPQH
jgi:tetratricopeptide (TPR) repeat protein